MSGNGEELPVDPFGKRGEGSGFKQSQARDRLREQTAEAAQDQFPFLSEGDVRVRQTDEGEVAEFTPEARRQIERRLAADEFDQQLDEFDVSLEDVEMTDDGVQLRQGVRRELAAQRFDSELPDAEITPSDLEHTDEGFAVNETVSREIAAERIDEELPEFEIDPGDLESTGEGFKISDEQRKEVAAGKLDDRIDVLDIRANYLTETDDGGFRIRDNQQQVIAARKIEGDFGVNVLASDIEPTDEGGFRIADQQKREQLAAQGFDEEFPDLEISRDDITETEEGFRLEEGVERLIAAQKIGEDIDLLDVGSEDLVRSTNDEGETVFRPTELFQQDLIRERVIAEDEDIQRGDILDVRELTPGEQVAAALRKSDLLSQLDVTPEVREELLASAEAGNLDEVFEDIEIPEYRPVFTSEFTREQVRTQLVSENEDITNEDILDIVELSPEEQVEALAGENPNVGDDDGALPEDRKEELVGLAESDDLDARFPETNVPAFKPVFTDSFQESQAIQQLIEQDDQIDREDIRGLERTDEGEFRPLFTEDFRKERFRQALAEESDVIDPEDIREVEALTPEEQAEVVIDQNVNLGPLSDRDVSFTITHARRAIEDPRIKVPSVVEGGEQLLVLDPDADPEAIREQLDRQDEDLLPEDVTAVEIAGEDRVAIRSEDGEIGQPEGDGIQQGTLSDLAQLAEEDRLDEKFENVDVPEFDPVLTPGARRERFAQQLAEQHEDISEADITGAALVPPEERVDFLLQERAEDVLETLKIGDGGGGSGDDPVQPTSQNFQQAREKLLEFAEEGQLQDIFPNAEFPLQPTFTRDFRRQRFRSALLDQEDITEEDIEGIETLTPAQQVERLIDNRAGIEPEDVDRKELLQLAEEGRLDRRFPDVNASPFQPDFTLEFQQEQFREALIEQDENVDPKDVEGVRPLSPAEQVSAVLNDDDVSVGDIQEQKDSILQLEQGFEAGKITAEQAQERLEEDFGLEGTPLFAPEFTQAFEREQTAQTLDEEFPDRDIGAGDVVPVEGGEGFQLAEDIRREIAAEELDEQIYDREIGPNDLIATDDGFRLRRAASTPADVLRQAQRQNPEFFIAMALDRQFEDVNIEEGDIEVPKGADVTFGSDLGDADFALDLDTRKEVAEDIATRQFEGGLEGVQVNPGDLERTEAGFKLDTEFQREIAAASIDSTFSGTDELTARQSVSLPKKPIDVDIEAADIEITGEGAQLREQGVQKIAAARIDRNLQIDVSSEDVERRAGDISLTREATARRLDRQVSFTEIGPEDVTARGGEFALAQSPQALLASELDERFSGGRNLPARQAVSLPRSPADVDITEENIKRTGVGLELDDDVRRQLAAVQIDRSLPVDVEASDLVETQRGFEPGEDVRAALQERAERSAAFRLSRELDRDISPDDVTTGPGGDIRISRDIREDLAFEQVQENTLIDVDRSDVEFGTKAEPDPFSVRGFGAQPGVDVRLTEDAARREHEALSSLEIDDGVDAEGQAFVTEGTVAPQADFTNDRESATGEALDAVAGIESAIGDAPLISQTRGAVRAGTSFSVSKLSGAADVASIITDPVTSASRGGRQAAEKFIVDPHADLVGDIFGVTDRLTPRDTNIGGLVEGATAELGGGAAAVTVGLPSTLGSGISTGTDITINAGETINEQGIARGSADIADTTADVGLRASRAGAQALQKRPFETIGRGIGALAIDTIAGTAAVRSLEFGTTVARARVQARGGPKVDLEDLTPQQRELIAQDGVAKFATSRTAPTKTAVAETRARARNVPKQLDDVVEADQVTFRSETSRLPKEFAAEVGEFELPGLYTGPDLSLLRFDQSSGFYGSGVSLRLPRLFAQPERVSAFETRNISGLPRDAAEAGFAVRDAAGDIVERFLPTLEGAKQARRLEEAIDGQRIPDPATAGAQFLDQTEDLKTAFVRATGDRTREAEAIFPPGAEFERVTTGLVKTPQGAPGTIDVFRPVRSKKRNTDSDIGGGGFDESLPATGGETFTAEEISALSRRSRSRSLPDDSPLTPAPGLTGGSGGVSAPSPSSTRTTTPSRLEASGPGIAEGISESARRTRDIEAAGSVRRTISGVGRTSGADAIGTGGLVIPEIERDGDSTGTGDRTRRSSGGADAIGTGGLVIPEIERDGDSTGTGDRTRTPLSDPPGVTTGTPDLTTQGGPSFESDPVAPPTTPPITPPTTPPYTSPPTTPPYTPPPTTPPYTPPPFTPPPTTPPYTPPPFTPPPFIPPPGPGGTVPPRPDVGSDNGQTGDIMFDSEIAKQFEGGVVSPGSVLTGSLDEFGGLASSEPSVTVIDDDATPKVTKIRGEVPGVDEDDFL
jgi:hypothetical protein